MTETELERANELLKKASILDPSIKAYQIGCTASRLNVHAQQIRAFNLVWALEVVGYLKSETCIGVVGGGISGITVASALLARGARVRIYESMRGLAHLQE